jgi:hypothetical protein
MAPRKTKTADQDEYTSGRRVDRMDSGEDPTTGDIKDSESPLSEDDYMDDDENITGDEELYESVENEDPADEKDAVEEEDDELSEDDKENGYLDPEDES